MADESDNQNQSPTLESLLETPWLGVREDLLFRPGALTTQGERTWLIEDPVSGQIFRIGFTEKELFLRLIKYPKLEDAVKALFQETGQRPPAEKIIQFIKMMQTEGLSLLPSDTIIDNLNKPKQPQKPEDAPMTHRLLHAYVYFRLPVLRPDRFLSKHKRDVQWLWSPLMRFIYLTIGTIGIIFTLEQFDAYINSISHLFTPIGAIAFVLCLCLLKIGHEFAHAFTAKSYGLHIRSMGIVFIVLWPILYTDTTDAWKLEDRKRRLHIDLAGITFELIIAGAALLLWALLPEGLLKSLMFYLSSTSLVSTLLVNVNPFMRFDGYYVLMDLWGVDNLQPRAFALMKDAIRRTLLDWQGSVPEYHPHRKRMIVYAVCASFYRLFIALVIAFAVYHLFFKALGIILLIIELWFFVLRPIWREISFIIQNRQLIGKRKRLILSGSIFATIMLLLVVPLPTVEILPAYVLMKNTNPIDAARAGELVNALPAKGTEVKKGDLVATITDHQLARDIKEAEYELKITQQKLFLLPTGGEEGGYRNWLVAEEKRIVSQLERLRQNAVQLEVFAPTDGVVTDINRQLYPGAWVGKKTYLLTIANPNAKEIKGYVHEHDLERISKAGFVEADIHFQDLETDTITATLVKQQVFPTDRLTNEALYDYAGGPIVSLRKEDRVQPRNAYFAFTFEITDSLSHLAHGTPCRVWMSGAYKSLTGRMWRSVAEWFADEGYI